MRTRQQFARARRRDLIRQPPRLGPGHVAPVRRDAVIPSPVVLRRRLPALRREWIRATDTAKRKQIADQVQTLAYDEVPYVPWGQYTQPTAYRKNVRGVLTFPASLYWNVSVEG